MAACTAAFGPGYTIDKQEIRVHFVPSAEPHILIDALYELRNTGNRPLSSLELRSPSPVRFHVINSQALWDSSKLAFEPSPVNPRNVLLTFTQPWAISTTHTLHLLVQYAPAAQDEPGLSFTSDAFFLPATGWTPQLLPARGLFATGGVPPPKWILTVSVPNDFLVHTSGDQSKSSKKHAELTIRALQHSDDVYPFVIAGRYSSMRLNSGQHAVNLWTHAQQPAASLLSPSQVLKRVTDAFDSTFGSMSEKPTEFWMVECPTAAGCFTNRESNYSKLVFGENASASAEMLSSDSVLLSRNSAAPEIVTSAAPALAASWLGYGQNPGFFEQVPPVSALPAFAAAHGREALEGPQVRAQTIRRLLQAVPLQGDSRRPETDAVVRAKSVLFFYALQDRYGPQVFSAALHHMLYARRRRGFNLNDLIAAFEEETHQNVAAFVRRWIKHTGVPQEFRANYENVSAATGVISKETTP
jgi:hypothetical protein